MPSFEYSALDKSTSKQVNETLQAESMAHAKTLIGARGFILLNIRIQKQQPEESEQASLFPSLRKNISMQKLMLFTRQLSTLLSSGMEIDAALKLIGGQADGKDMRVMLTRLRSNLAEGMTLAQSMERSGMRFPKDYIATIAAGEETGHMMRVCERLADEVEHSAKTMQGLLSALLYPAVMLLVAFSVIVGLMVYVVPQIAEVFSDSRQALPTITVVVVAMSNFLIANGVYLLLAMVSLVIGFFWRLRRSEAFRLQVHKKILRLPLFGNLILFAQVGRWARGFGMLLASGVPTLQALRISTQTLSNQYLHDVMQQVVQQMREGQSLHAALRTHDDIIPSFLVHMSASGEASGNLDDMMLKVSDYYVQFVRMSTETGIKLFEPVLIVVMGGVVLFIVLAVLLPIFELNSLV